MEKNTKRTIVEMAHASSLGIVMVLSIFGCLLLGAYLDRKFQTTTNVFTVFFLIIGIIAGFRNIYIFLKRLLAQEQRESEQAKEVKKPKNVRPRKRPSFEKD
ncbi:MAG: AtpZ/AtpI family protein [Syntrophales bacterium]|nr:AtpZ/AtpI family protein [Syntrophales bacterium]MCK9527801.1 AtpZ/AtpI family protein [Syntrophales bacterium]MDX9922102.1 AtpZ/AtpI family protein [Syntrophales bacterium]